MLAKSFASILVGAISLATGVGAQGMSLGEFEYTNSCAVCHGADGRGHGPLENMLNTSPSDLTALQKGNNGVFPVQRVYDFIDGTGFTAAHGSRDMPVWGSRYLARVESQSDFAMSPEQREEYARTRILALIEYLSTIQE